MSESNKNKDSESNKNITWQLNHSIIRDSYVRLIKKLKRKPTYDEVSKDANLSIKTIREHINTLKFEPQKHPLRILSDDILISIANAAKGGSAASQKLWMQICEGWTEKQIMEHTGDMNINDAREKLIEKLINATGNKGNNKKS